MLYEKPDMKVYSKKTIDAYEDVALFIKHNSIGKSVTCTGNGGISVDISQIKKNIVKKHVNDFTVPKGT